MFCEKEINNNNLYTAWLRISGHHLVREPKTQGVFKIDLAGKNNDNTTG